MAIKPFMFKDVVPEEGEIECAVKRLCNNRSGGASRMRAEHIKVWLAAARGAYKEVEALVGADPTLIQEAWYQIQGW